jgi:hypothetical protein
MNLSRDQIIPVWARLEGYREPGSADSCWSLRSLPGASHPWAVPVQITDDAPDGEGMLRVRVLQAGGAVAT